MFPTIPWTSSTWMCAFESVLTGREGCSPFECFRGDWSMSVDPAGLPRGRALERRSDRVLCRVARLRWRYEEIVNLCMRTSLGRRYTRRETVMVYEDSLPSRASSRRVHQDPVEPVYGAVAAMKSTACRAHSRALAAVCGSLERMHPS